MKEQMKTGWQLEHSYAQLPELFFAKTDPTPVKDAALIRLNTSLARELGLDVEGLKSDAGVDVFAGNALPEGAYPIAQAYAGHQFANFTKLGDGRAILLGEQMTPNGDRLDIQLKGSGRTPYSRGGDGRAALGPMLREYIISEAMHALGIPTTRGLAVVTTGEDIFRGIDFPGAILTRVAKSHLRVGTFQYAANWGTVSDVKQLADYAIKRHDSELLDRDTPYVDFLKAVIKRQARLVAQWQLVGFIHGVMNTDNVSIAGETIDYGPCAFMDTYDPKTVFSSIDRQGRYAYGNQPYIGAWNVARLAESILPLLADDEKEALEIAQSAISEYNTIYHETWLSGMRKKIGLCNEETEDAALVQDLLAIMEESQADYTNTFRSLTFAEVDEMALLGNRKFAAWKERWHKRLEKQQADWTSVQNMMKQHNPAIIPRNHRVEEVLNAAVDGGNYQPLTHLLRVLSDPYAHAEEQKPYTTFPKTTEPFVTYCGT